MKARIEGNVLFIEIEIDSPIMPSASGKTLVVASSHGNIVSSAMVDGKPVIIGLNAYVKR